jgi:phosphatidylinositol alpha-1,6-mannosyltransferase
VLTASSHEGAETFDQESEVVVERIAASTLFLPTPKALRAIEAAIERHQPDLVLLDPAWPLGLLGPRLSRPFGVVLHGAEVTIPGRLPFVASSLRYVLRHATVAVCAGSYPEREARRVAAEYMPAVVQIPPGVDTERFAPLNNERKSEVRRLWGLSDDTLLVASYSRLVPRKGMDTLIRASAKLRSGFPSMQVMIGGEGRDRPRLEKLARRLGAPVTFLGRIPDDQLSDWLATSDLMVMDCRSRWLGLEQEGFGIVFVEAAASGVAQIAGRSGGSDEAVIDLVTGVVITNSRSSAALSEALHALLSDGQLRTHYAMNSRHFAVSRFDWASLARRLSVELAPFDHYGAENQRL